MNTSNFLAVISDSSRSAILSLIARNYGITEQEAYDEVTDSESEPLLNYLTCSTRAAVSALKQKHGIC